MSNDAPSGSSTRSTELTRTLGPVQLVFYCVGVIVGAGVYSIIGSAAGLAGLGVWLGFVLAALVALLTAFSYAEMATSFPSAGAEYIYVRRAFPRCRFLSFSTGILILIGAGATAATVAVAFGGYLQTFVDIPVGASAFTLLAFCALINLWGLQESSWVNIAFTCIEISGLLLVIAAGAVGGDLTAPLSAPIQPGLLPAAAVLFFVFLGFEEIANLAEEIHDPSRVLPRALFLSMAITTLLYVLVSLAVVVLASPAELAASKAPLATAIQKVWPGAAHLLSAIALFATANTVLITLVAASRLVFSLARDSELPKIFAGVTAERRSPWMGAMLSFLLSAALLPIGDLKILAELSSFVAMLAFLAVNITLLVLRYQLPEHPRPFRVPLQLGRLALIPLAAVASILVLLVGFDGKVYVAGGVVIALICLAYVVRGWWR